MAQLPVQARRQPPPTYEHSPAKVSSSSVRPRHLATVIDTVFFAVAGLAAIWLAVTLAAQGLEPARLWYWIPFWVVLTYLALPRLHRVLTWIYVPDYFIGRTRTSDGLLGDPVNIAFLGTAKQIHQSMEEAGWELAEEITWRSGWRMIISSLTGRSYPRAPVSPLFLFGERHAFCYQQEVDGNPRQRHHVRFYPCPEGWLLPGGHRADWLAAGTFDRSVGLSLFTFQITHRIDADIDIERDYIVATLEHRHPEIDTRVIEDFSTGYHHRNGGGDLIRTDGDLPVVDLRPIVPTGHSPVTPPTRRPVMLVLAGLLIALMSVPPVVLGVSTIIDPDTFFGLATPDHLWHLQAASAVVLAIAVLAICGLAVAVAFGVRWTRMLTMVLLTLVIWVLISTGTEYSVVGLAVAATGILALLALSSTSVRRWMEAERRAHGASPDETAFST